MGPLVRLVVCVVGGCPRAKICDIIFYDVNNYDTCLHKEAADGKNLSV